MNKVDFRKIDEIEALLIMKADYKVFSDAMIVMMGVDNFDNFIPSGLRAFSTFFFTNHTFIYENQKNYEIIYFEFLKWIKKEKKI